MCALPLDLRKRVINAWQKKKLTTEELADIFGIGEATVKRWQRQYRETKSLAPKPHGGGNPPRIAKEDWPKVQALVQQHPDWTEEQYAKTLEKEHGIRASSVTVGRVIRKLGYSVKKRPSSPKNGTVPTSLSADETTSSESKTSPFRVWFLWTKPARTSR